MPVRARSRSRPAGVPWSLRSFCCRASSSAMRTSRPFPDADRVQRQRREQGPQISGSNSTTWPGSNVEIPLAEEVGRPAVAARPWFCEHGTARLDDFLDQRAVHVGAVDGEAFDVQVPSLQVRLECRRRFLFRTVRRRERAGEDERTIEVRRDMLFISIESFAFTLTAVPHVGILDRNAAVLGDAAPQAHAAVFDLQILLAHLRERLDVRLERLLDRQLFLIEPVIQPGQLTGQPFDRLVFLDGVIPIDIEPGLDAR